MEDGTFLIHIIYDNVELNGTVSADRPFCDICLACRFQS